MKKLSSLDLFKSSTKEVLADSQMSFVFGGAATTRSETHNHPNGDSEYWVYSDSGAIIYGRYTYANGLEVYF